MPAEFHALAREVNNWGRWGGDDEKGTLNLLDTAAVLRGVAAVRTGACVPLAIPLSSDGPQRGYVPGRFNPLRFMVSIHAPLTGDVADFCSSDDVVVMPLQAATHWDSLAHVSYAGRMYNGVPTSSVDATGAARAGIDKVGSVVGRGVLLDVARTRGVDRLAPGQPVTGADLDAAEATAGLAVHPGDIVLIRTGHMQLLHAGDARGYGLASPGPGTDAVRWFRRRDVAAAATDTMAFEVVPWEQPDAVLPVHLLDIVEMGLTQGQNFDLEALSAACAADGRYEFLLSATPEPFVRGLGAPVSPVAVR